MTLWKVDGGGGGGGTTKKAIILGTEPERGKIEETEFIIHMPLWLKR